MTGPLYSTDILRLAASIARVERLADPMASVERRSPVCGSRIAVDVQVDENGRVTESGMIVRACALGQASAALLHANLPGRNAEELASARDALAAWLAGQTEEVPDWPGIAVLGAARPHSARHASILLGFESAAAAVTEAMNRRSDAA